MTVIAWDGKALCGDRMASASGMPFSVTKVFRVNAGRIGIVGIDGGMASGLRLVKWIINGEKPEEYPDCQKDDNQYCHALFITSEKKILRYERQITPIEIEEPFFAVGTGRDFAMAAMALGKTSREGVLLASRYDENCGRGFDEMSL